MKDHNLTLAIYGIQDSYSIDYPYFVHDHSVVIFEGGKINNFIQLERITRKKYDNKLPKHLYQMLKDEGLLGKNNYDFVFVDNVLGRAFISNEGNIRFEANWNDQLSNNLEKGRIYWKDKFFEGYVLNHELAHIYSCVPFFGDFRENSLLVHFDGGASKSNFSAWLYKNEKIELLEYHWNLKYLSGFFNANALVFSIINGNIKNQNSVPGKFMGYASYGSYDYNIERWLLKNNYFNDIWNDKSIFFNKFKSEFRIDICDFNLKNKYIQDIAATIHAIFERELLNKIIELADRTNAEYLYYSGGSALNISANSKIINAGVFNDVFIPPCANDSGLAIGAGSLMEIAKGNGIEKCNAYLNNFSISSYQINYSFDDIKLIAEKIIDGKIIGICNGYGEVGPRALGNRSIIAMANSNRISTKLSVEMKCREWYRPLAPIMLEKNAMFYTSMNNIHHLSKYMLLEFQINKELQNDIIGVVHCNGTSRIQTLYSREDNPFMYDLLEYLDSEYNIKALINTSFNKNGEPLVHTKEDAIISGKEMGLDGIVLDGKYIEL